MSYISTLIISKGGSGGLLIDFVRLYLHTLSSLRERIRSSLSKNTKIISVRTDNPNFYKSAYKRMSDSWESFDEYDEEFAIADQNSDKTNKIKFKLLTNILSMLRKISALKLNHDYFKIPEIQKEDIIQNVISIISKKLLSHHEIRSDTCLLNIYMFYILNAYIPHSCRVLVGVSENSLLFPFLEIAHKSVFREPLVDKKYCNNVFSKKHVFIIDSTFSIKNFTLFYSTHTGHHVFLQTKIIEKELNQVKKNFQSKCLRNLFLASQFLLFFRFKNTILKIYFDLEKNKKPFLDFYRTRQPNIISAGEFNNPPIPDRDLSNKFISSYSVSNTSFEKSVATNQGVTDLEQACLQIADMFSCISQNTVDLQLKEMREAENKSNKKIKHDSSDRANTDVCPDLLILGLRHVKSIFNATNNNYADYLDINKNLQSIFLNYDRNLKSEIPNSKTKLKMHPDFVLESNLSKRFTVFPKRPILGYYKGEPIFYRKNIKALLSLKQLFRKGLELKEDTIKPYRNIKKGIDFGESIDVYAPWQLKEISISTLRDLKDKLSKNHYKNASYFHPNHIPKDSCHINYQYASNIASIMKIEFVPTTTRFQSRTPVVEGVFIEKNNRCKLEAFLMSYVAENKIENEIMFFHSNLKMWKRIVKKAKKYLSIKKKIDGL